MSRRTKSSSTLWCKRPCAHRRSCSSFSSWDGRSVSASNLNLRVTGSYSFAPMFVYEGNQPLRSARAGGLRRTQASYSGRVYSSTAGASSSWSSRPSKRVASPVAVNVYVKEDEPVSCWWFCQTPLRCLQAFAIVPYGMPIKRRPPAYTYTGTHQIVEESFFYLALVFALRLLASHNAIVQVDEPPVSDHLDELQAGEDDSKLPVWSWRRLLSLHC